ncbi:MAG TPA: hypothetical protein VGC74_07160 [Stenotrophomonas sp.]|jgi:hypothetical protein
MNSKSFTRSLPFTLLLTGSVLLSAGWLGTASGRTTDTGADYGVSEADEENAATTPEQAPRPVRRARSSLSMPYFSFAQALRPRS